MRQKLNSHLSIAQHRKRTAHITISNYLEYCSKSIRVSMNGRKDITFSKLVSVSTSRFQPYFVIKIAQFSSFSLVSDHRLSSIEYLKLGEKRYQEKLIH